MTDLEELSDSSNLSEDKNVEKDPIVVSENAGATFRTPAGAAIARKRKLPTNKGMYKQRGSKKPVATSAWDRLKEFPNNHFAVVSQKLRCNACNEMISKKKSSIAKHVESKKHKKGLADVAKNKTENRTIMACLERRNNSRPFAASRYRSLS
jgi:hypothetical protein